MVRNGNIEDGEKASSLEISSSSSLSSKSAVILGTFFAVSGSYVFGCAIGYSSPTQAGIMKDLTLSLSQYSVFGSILEIGAMVGALLSGRIADVIGRRGAMWVADVFCILGWFSIFLAKRSWSLILGRLSLGYGIGLLSYVVPVFVAEITPKSLRGSYTTLHQLMICFGASITWVLGILLPWRILAMIGLVPCIVQIIGLVFVPESPRWLAKIGKEKDFEAALQRLRGKKADISEEAAEIRDYTESLRRLKETRILDLFQRKYAHALIVGVGLMVLQQFGGVNGISFYASSIFNSAGFSSRVGTMAMTAVNVPMTILNVLLMDKTGRRPLLMISTTGTCLGCLLDALSFLLQGHHLLKDVTPKLALIGLMVYTGSFSLGMGAVPWVIMSEIFPINTKGSAGSLVTMVNWLGSWVISYTFNYLMKWSSAGTFFMFSTVCGLTVLFVSKLVPETKGRTLEEIQASMNSFTSHNIKQDVVEDH